MIREDLKMTEEQIRKAKDYKNQYRRDNYRRLTLRFRKDDTSGVHEKLDSVENINEYIYNLILADIKKEAK